MQAGREIRPPSWQCLQACRAHNYVENCQACLTTVAEFAGLLCDTDRVFICWISLHLAFACRADGTSSLVQRLYRGSDLGCCRYSSAHVCLSASWSSDSIAWSESILSSIQGHGWYRYNSSPYLRMLIAHGRLNWQRGTSPPCEDLALPVVLPHVQRPPRAVIRTVLYTYCNTCCTVLLMIHVSISPDVGMIAPA